MDKRTYRKSPIIVVVTNIMYINLKRR